MKIFLWGYMGCGKSYIGKQLAKELSWEFVDLDVYIITQEAESIKSIFENRGEDIFRILERKYLHEISQKDEIVIALGGGTPCFFDNASYMNSCGITVFLDVSINMLVRRLENSKHRPLLSEKKNEEMASFVATQYMKRIAYYEQAKYRISGDNIYVEDLLPLFLRK